MTPTFHPARALRRRRPWPLFLALFLALAAPASAATWTVQNGDLYRDGQRVVLKGINWFGMETETRAPHGLWTSRTLDSFLAQIDDLGFNAIRLPLSPETIRPGYPVDGYATPYAATGREMLRVVLEAAEGYGLDVLLDLHRINPNSDALPGRFDVDGYTTADWIADLTSLAELAGDYDNVIGIDLLNEPYALTWSQWSGYASQAGQAILDVNPDLLVFVEGVGNASPTGGYGANWGGNLYEAGPIAGIPASKLVFSPHAYGPSVAAQGYFNDPSFPANMPGIWDTLFGHLFGDYAVVPGEFGGTYVGADATWQDAFADYLVDRGADGYFYWSLNPNSGDTGGILADDWTTLVQPKIDLLDDLNAGLGSGGGGGGSNADPVASFTASATSGPAPLAVSVDASGSTDADGDALAFAWDFGDGATATGVTASHTYASAGSYTLTLTVTDGAGGSDQATRTVSVTSGGGGGGDGIPLAVRARGTSGTESISLTVGGTTVASWTLSTGYQTYTATTTDASGALRVAFTNDASGRDVQVDYLVVDGETRQAEAQAVNTGVWQDGACGGGNGLSEWLHCNGYIDFGSADSSGGGGGGGGGEPGTGLAVTYTITNEWSGGFGASVTIANGGTTAVDGWTLGFRYAAGTSISSLWNGTLATSGTQYTVTPVGWNAQIAPGASVSFGFNGTYSGTRSGFLDCTINGDPCAQAAARQVATDDAPDGGLVLETPAPNPVASRTAIRYALPEATDVHLAVFDALGREVAVLADGRQSAGSHTAVWEPGALPPGTYLVRLDGDGASQTRRVVVLR